MITALRASLWILKIKNKKIHFKESNAFKEKNNQNPILFNGNPKKCILVLDPEYLTK